MVELRATELVLANVNRYVSRWSHVVKPSGLRLSSLLRGEAECCVCHDRWEVTPAMRLSKDFLLVCNPVDRFLSRVCPGPSKLDRVKELVLR